MMLRVISWPMGFILVAKGEANLFFWTELVSNLINVALIWFGVLAFGLEGTGIAFFALYVVYAFGIYLVVRRVSGFRWSAANRHLGFLFVALVGLVFGAWYLPSSLIPGLPSHFIAGALGAVVTLATGYYCMRVLCTLIPLDRLPRPMYKLAKLLRLAS